MIIDATFEERNAEILAKFGNYIKGEKGDTFRYEDLTEEQKAEIANSAILGIAGKQIDEIASDVAINSSDNSINKRNISNNAKKIESATKRITNLEAKIAPKYFVTDDESAFRKDVPVNACPYAQITKIGGMTRKCTNLATPFNIGYDMNDVTGEVVKNDKARATTDLIAVNIVGDNTYIWSNIVSIFTSCVYFYNANKEYLGRCPATYREQFVINKTQLTANLTNIGGDIAYIRLWQSVANSGETIDLVTKQPPMLNIGSTALPYEPYFEGLRSAPVSELVSEGANLIPFPYKDSSQTVRGISYTVNDDGSITANGTATGYASLSLCENIEFKAGETYCLHGGKSNVSIQISYYDVNEPDKYRYLNDTTFTWKSDWRLQLIYVQVVPDVTINNVTVYPMLNKGTTALPYRPYFKRTLPIPEAVRPANGINETVYDYIEWCEDGTRKKRVKCGLVDMGTLNWTYVPNNTYFKCLSSPSDMAFNRFDYTTPANLLCVKYSTRAWSDIASTHDDFIALQESYFAIKDSSYTDVATFKAAMSGVMLLYELAEPEVTDISDILTADNFVKVQAYGSMTPVNEFGYDVPTEINYMLKEGNE